jgi:hypothetical protein
MSTSTSAIKIAIVPEEKILEIEQKIDMILSYLSLMMKDNPPRTEFTVRELSKMRGYSRATILRIIHANHIPYEYQGKDIVISKEHAGRIKEKVKKTERVSDPRRDDGFTDTRSNI